MVIGKHIFVYNYFQKFTFIKLSDERSLIFSWLICGFKISVGGFGLTSFTEKVEETLLLLHCLNTLLSKKVSLSIQGHSKPLFKIHITRINGILKGKLNLVQFTKNVFIWQVCGFWWCYSWTHCPCWVTCCSCVSSSSSYLVSSEFNFGQGCFVKGASSPRTCKTTPCWRANFSSKNQIKCLFITSFAVAFIVGMYSRRWTPHASELHWEWVFKQVVQL